MYNYVHIRTNMYIDARKCERTLTDANINENTVPHVISFPIGAQSFEYISVLSLDILKMV